jgi:hypothetical protein
MGLALVTTLAFCLWIVLWAVDVKGFDAMMLTVLIVLVAATLKSLLKYLPGVPSRRGDGSSGGW